MLQPNRSSQKPYFTKAHVTLNRELLGRVGAVLVTFDREDLFIYLQKLLNEAQKEEETPPKTT